MRYSFLVCMMAAILVACGEQSPKTADDHGVKAAIGKSDMSDADYDRMASELCACLQPVLELTEALQRKQSQGDEAGMVALLDNLEQIMQTSEACVDEVDQKYSVTTEEGQQRATEALERACPDIMAMLHSIQ